MDAGVLIKVLTAYGEIVTSQLYMQTRRALSLSLSLSLCLCVCVSARAYEILIILPKQVWKIVRTLIMIIIQFFYISPTYNALRRIVEKTVNNLSAFN